MKTTGTKETGKLQDTILINPETIGCEMIFESQFAKSSPKEENVETCYILPDFNRVCYPKNMGRSLVSNTSERIKFIQVTPDFKLNKARKQLRTTMGVAGVLTFCVLLFSLVNYKAFHASQPLSVTQYQGYDAKTFSDNFISGLNRIIKESDDPTNSFQSEAIAPVKVAKPFVKYQQIVLEPVANGNFVTYPFESFRAEFNKGVAQLKWVDSELRNTTYFVEKSEDGENFEISQVIDGNPGKETSTFMISDKKPSAYYRLVKVVHGGSVYHSKIFGVENASVISPDLHDNYLSEVLPS